MAIIYVPPHSGGKGSDGNDNPELRQSIEKNTSEISKIREQQNDIAEDIRIESEKSHADNVMSDIEQSRKLELLEEKDRKQDVYMKGLFNENADERITVQVTGNYNKLESAVDGLAEINEIEGNTLVNLAKDGETKFILNGDINVEGVSPTVTGTVEGGKVDVELQGNTLVNVCDQKDPIPLTRYYEVYNTNHVSLQGEYDGKAKPYVFGNTLVNLTTGTYFMNAPTKGDVVRDGNRITFIMPSDSVFTQAFNIILHAIKPSTQYTVIVNIAENTMTKGKFAFLNSEADSFGETVVDIRPNTIGIQKYLVTSKDVIPNVPIIRSYMMESEIDEKITIEDVIVLEGDWTDKDIPQYFEGLQSSFEDRCIPVNLATPYEKSGQYFALDNRKNTMKLSKITCYNKDTDFVVSVGRISDLTWVKDVSVYKGEPRVIEPLEGNYIRSVWYNDESVLNTIIIEGDYTNYDFSTHDHEHQGKYKVEYKVTGKNKFSGIVNNFAYNHIYTWSVDSTGLLSADNKNEDIRPWGYEYSQYKFNLRKGAYTITLETVTPSTNQYAQIYIYEKNNGTAIASFGNSLVANVGTYSIYLPLNKDTEIGIEGKFFDGTYRIQIEENNVPTTYEPYKEYTKTLYLNSPLLERDSIEISGNNIYHVHRYKQVMFDGDESWGVANSDMEDCIRVYTQLPPSDVYSGENRNIFDCMTDYLVTPKDNNKISIKNSGYVYSQSSTNAMYILFIEKSKCADVDKWKAYLRQNPLTLVYSLANPTWELISTDDNLFIDSYVNGHLDFNTVIPVEKVIFTNPSFAMKYIKPSTQCTIQFECDNNGEAVFSVGGSDYTSNGYMTISKGINKFTRTLNETLSNDRFWISGIGCNISNIVVTESTGDFGYFEGISSAFENVPENIINIDYEINTQKGYIADDTWIISNSPNIIINKNNISLNCDGQINVLFKRTSNSLQLKPNTQYTLVFDVLSDTFPQQISIGNNDKFNFLRMYLAKGLNIYTITTNDFSTAKEDMYIYLASLYEGDFVFRFYMLEGDYTNYDFSNYGKHKADVVVTGKNIYNGEVVMNQAFDLYLNRLVVNSNSQTTGFIRVKPNTTYFISNKPSYANRFLFVEYDSNKQVINTTQYLPLTTSAQTEYVVYYYYSGATDGYKDPSNNNIMFEEGTVATEYKPYKSSTKSIYLQQPLRGLPNGVCDRVVKRDGKWYVERNCAKVVFDGSEDEGLTSHEYEYEELARWQLSINDDYVANVGICDKLPVQSNTWSPTQPCIRISLEKIQIWLDKNVGMYVSNIRQWLQDNPLTVVYQLATPTYEEITDMEFTTYLDTTHISNNSNIPCNMKVRNSGYECILKPNTTYTPIGVTNCRIGNSVMSNGVITTGSTVDDNILRPYGGTSNPTCGNVMLLEGDWVNKNQPKYFDGMKSFSEIEDNKIKLISNGKNLWNYNDLYNQYTTNDYTAYVNFEGSLINKNEEYCIETFDNSNGWLRQGVFSTPIYFKKGQQITFSGYVKGGCSNASIFELSNFGKVISAMSNFNTNDEYEYFCINYTVNKDGYYIARFWCKFNEKTYLKNIQFEISPNATEYEPYKESTIEYQLPSPLRGFPNGVCDKIVERNGKLYIERNCSEIVLDGSREWSYHSSDSNYFYRTDTVRCKGSIDTPCISDKIIDTQNYSTMVSTQNTMYHNSSAIIVHLTNDLTDVNKFKTHLSNNPINVLLPLETPTYEELTDDKLIIQAFESGLITFNSVIPANSSTITYSTSTPSTYGLRDVDREQDEYINTILITTDEMYRLIEPLLFTTMSEDGVSRMVYVYVAMVERGLKEIDEVPLRFREKVREILE